MHNLMAKSGGFDLSSDVTCIFVCTSAMWAIIKSQDHRVVGGSVPTLCDTVPPMCAVTQPLPQAAGGGVTSAAQQRASHFDIKSFQREVSCDNHIGIVLQRLCLLVVVLVLLLMVVSCRSWW